MVRCDPRAEAGPGFRSIPNCAPDWPMWFPMCLPICNRDGAGGREKIWAQGGVIYSELGLSLQGAKPSILNCTGFRIHEVTKAQSH